MPKVMKICKACGKEYEACHTPNPGVFRWRDIACSPECAEKYIHDVMVARGEIQEEKAEEPKMESAVVEEEQNQSQDNGFGAVYESAPFDGEDADAERPSRHNRSKRK